MLFVLFRIFIFPSERPELIKAIRVDLVALPDKNPQEGPVGTPPPDEPLAEKEKPPKDVAKEAVSETKKPEFVEKKTEKKEEKKKKEEPEKITAKKDDGKQKNKEQQNAALDRLKALSRLKEKMAETSEKEGHAYKGNVLSEGNSLTGVDKLQHDQYLGKLDAHIKNNWRLPAWLVNKPLSAAVFVRFDDKGQLLEKRIVRSSGNTEFDTEALRAIENSAPFPAPPEHLVSYFKVKGIELRFPE
ncbi:MAG: TonB family protein [Bdellovibrionaceae bacterium]|nr:TonB family protein [Pseudobdellovibrionaceae bacterium]